MFAIILLILLIVFIGYLLLTDNNEGYTNVTKRYPVYHYYDYPFYIENNEVPYMYLYYRYPKDHITKYYMPEPYSIGYFKQT